MRNFTLASKKSSVLHCKFLATHRIMKKWSKWETSRRAPKQISVYIIFHCKFWVTHCVRSVKLRNFKQKKVLFILFSTFQFFSLSFYPELGGYTDIIYLRKFLGLGVVPSNVSKFVIFMCVLIKCYVCFDICLSNVVKYV